VTRFAEDKVQQPCAPHPRRERVEFFQGDAVPEQPGGIALPVRSRCADSCAAAGGLLLEMSARSPPRPARRARRSSGTTTSGATARVVSMPAGKE